MRKWIRRLFCRHHRHLETMHRIDLVWRLMRCKRCGRYFAEGTTLPGCPLLTALESDLPPRAHLL